MRSLMAMFCLLLLTIMPAAPAVASGIQPLMAIAAAAPAPVPTGLGIRLLDMPANAKDDPRARAYIVDRLAPGAEIRRRIRVVNNTGAPQSVRLYPGVAHIKDGSFLGDGAGTKNELSAWTTLQQQQLELAPGESADVMTIISVPRDAPESEQYGAVWAEMRSTNNDRGTRSNVTEVNRVGIRIYLSVGPGNGKPADFTITSFTAARDTDGKPQLSVLVTNTGGRALDVTGHLTLSQGPGGLSAGPFSVQKASTMASGEAQDVVFPLSVELPNGPWTAKAHLKSGLLERESSAPVTFPDKGLSSAPAPVQEPGISWLPLVSAALALSLAMAIGMIISRSRRRPARS